MFFRSEAPLSIFFVFIFSLCAQGTLLKSGRDVSHNKQTSPDQSSINYPPSAPRVTYSSLAGTSPTTNKPPRSVRYELPPSVPRVTYSSLAGTSHKTINLPRSVWRKLPPSVPMVTYSSLAGTSQPTYTQTPAKHEAKERRQRTGEAIEFIIYLRCPSVFSTVINSYKKQLMTLYSSLLNLLL